MKTLPAIMFILAMLLSGCAVLTGTPVAPPAPTDRAQEIQRDQTASLTPFDRVTVNERGSPMDAERAIAYQANAHHATYYQIIMLGETITPGIWRAEAILYR
ncbi:biofilm peroxide resistance protein BsmA [Acerihabitans sp. TG2]|uniref:biofilm peroxide resistance protein BsmA n=1 Tax=Acerihabitans sp. TG2 TaxID=3096008 RepID=UPI002B225974|nr:biofilm peroxide resistance protein BsmA [Acerihabitans sp. TG2]MEA9393090.1 biofilm peroxide resistance protein BsmA [Acerihabitans sp. TG2]